MNALLCAGLGGSVRDKFTIGDKVRLTENPFDEQIPEEAMRFAAVNNKTHVVTRTKDVPSGQWIKTDLINEWISFGWFVAT